LPYACGGGGAGFPYGSSGHYCYCGKPHTGGGGGGGANGGSGNGGTGGSGIVIIKACRVAVSVCGGTGPTCVGGKKMYVFNTSGSITF